MARLRPGQASQARKDQVGPGNPRPGDARQTREHARPGEAKRGQPRQGRPGEAKPGKPAQARQGKTRPGPGHRNTRRLAQASLGEARTEARRIQGRQGEVKQSDARRDKTKERQGEARRGVVASQQGSCTQRAAARQLQLQPASFGEPVRRSQLAAASQLQPASTLQPASWSQQAAASKLQPASRSKPVAASELQ